MEAIARCHLRIGLLLICRNNLDRPVSKRIHHVLGSRLRIALLGLHIHKLLVLLVLPKRGAIDV